MIFSKLLRFKILIFILFCGAYTEASQVRILVGPKVESAKKTGQSRSRTNPLSLIMEFDSRMYKNIYMSIGASGEFDVGSLSSTGFGLYGSARYYIKGDPGLISSKGKDIQVSFVEPYSYFVGLGFFQKSISFDGSTTITDIKEDVGGLIFSGGGNYSLTTRYYLTGYAQYLLSGSGTKLEYSSLEAYAGIGIRF